MSLLHIAGGATEDKLMVEDVFSTYLYTGNGSTQTINNGIDLAGKGGMVWIKSRNAVRSNAIFSTAQGGGSVLYSDLTGASISLSPYSMGFNSNGFATPNFAMSEVNVNTQTHVSWTFRKAPKFFDIVTYTGNGVAGRQIPHSLGCEVGMMTIKSTTTTRNWGVYHRSVGNGALYLNSTSAAFAPDTIYWNNVTPTSTYFTLGTWTSVNEVGVTYIAYLYAHDTSADGIIQCGSFTTDGSGNASVNLGWEPQYLMGRLSAGISDWYINDSMRGMPTDTNAKMLRANLSAIEGDSNIFYPTATGFKASGWGAGVTVIYLAIRRPMKTPTSGTEVYNAIARTGTGAVATVSGVGFAPDLVIPKRRTSSGYGTGFYDRLRGKGLVLNSARTDAEFDNSSSMTSFDMNGISVGADPSYTLINGGTIPYINHFVKRAKGFMDEVCGTGIGVFPHSLGVTPELVISKTRNYESNWVVWHKSFANTDFAVLNSNAQKTVYSKVLFGTMNPLNIEFPSADTIGGGSSGAWVTYLFATLAGVSKVGSYTGNGTSLNIDCGFATGARFFLVKRTDAPGDWFIFDTARGIVANNDPHLSLNTTSAEVTTDDSVDPYNLGITVNQLSATNINVNGATYIYLAIS